MLVKGIDKIKLLFFILLICVFIFIFTLIIKNSFASYVSNSTMKLEANTAVYIFDSRMTDFNIDLGKLVPNEEPYIYSFSIANYNDERTSDVDLSYTISLLSTTNLPLEFRLYKNVENLEGNNINILSTNEIVSDVDGTWYRLMNVADEVTLYRTDNTIDYYYLVVNFPREYSVDESYSGLIDNIEVKINSKQIVE